MNKDCAMARDLMPLVIDDVASGESREFVETHLSGCEECSAVYAEMKKEIPSKTEQEKAGEQAAFTKAAGKMKKKRRLRILKYILLGSLIGCIALGTALLVFDRVTQAREHIYYGFYGVYMSELKNSDIVFTMDYRGSYDELSAMVKPATEKNLETGEEKRVLYVYLEKYRVNRINDRPGQNSGFLTLTAGELQEYDEIRRGVPEEYVTIWKPGDPIDPASEEMETYYFWDRIDRQFWENAEETPDGKAGYASHETEQCWQLVGGFKHETFATVPEWQPYNGMFMKAGPLDQELIRYVLSELRERGYKIDTPNPYEAETPDKQEE